MADQDGATKSFAKAESSKEDFGEELAAKTHNSETSGVEPAAAFKEEEDVSPRRAARFARSVSYRVSVSNNEAQILRERQDWLRSLDRKYGITR